MATIVSYPCEGDAAPEAENSANLRVALGTSEWWWQIELLIGCSIIVVLSFVLQVPADGQTVYCGTPRFQLPPTCLSHAWFGVECPGCGLSRSFIRLAHGDWQGAWRMHRLGWLLALSVLVQFPYRICILARNHAAPLGKLIPRYFGYLVFALLIGNWLCRMF
jgi:hypothetical protein